MSGIEETIRQEERAYAGDAPRPLRGYVGTLLAYAGGVGAAGLLIWLRGRPLPASVSPWDLLLISMSTHKLSRRLAKDPITSPLRAPFTRYKGTAGPAEVKEEVRGSGAQHAVGELVTCPFCTAQWVATAHVAGLVLAPRLTRLVAGTMTAVGASDWLQLGYARLEGGSG